LYNKKVDGLAHELSRKRRDPQQVVISKPIFDFQVVAFAVAKITETAAKYIKERSEAGRLLCGQPTDAKDLGRWLRGGGNRPRHYTPGNFKEVASSHLPEPDKHGRDFALARLQQGFAAGGMGVFRRAVPADCQDRALKFLGPAIYCA
jgi:hypothetical protein